MGIKRQFFWSMTPLLVISAVNIISVRLFYQFLGPEMYAIWFYVIALNGAFGFTDLGVSAAMGRFLGMALGAQDRAALEQYWGTGNLLALVIISVMAAIVAAVGVLFGPDWFQVAPGRVHLLQWAFVAGGFGLWMGYYGNFWLVLSQAHFDFKFIGICRSVFNLAQVGVGLWLAWLTHNPLVLIAAGALFGFLQVLLFAWHAARHYRLGMGFGHFRKGRAREMFGISNKVFGTILMGSVGGSMDRLILGKLAPPAPFAHYNICNSFGSRIGNLGGSIMGPIIQQTSRALGRGDYGRATAVFNESFDWTFGFYALAAIWTVFWHPLLLRLWLGADLGRAVAPAFTPLVIAYCISGIGMVSTAQLIPLNRAGMELIFVTIRTICLGGLAALGWHWGGLAGVAWGVLASRAVTMAQDIYTIRLLGAGGWLAWRTWRNLLAQIVVGAAFFGVGRLLPPAWQWLMIPAALHGGIVAAWLLRHQLRKVFTRARPAAA